MYKKYLPDFKKDLKQLVKITWLELLKKQDVKELAGFAIFTNSEMSTFFIVANTVNNINKSKYPKDTKWICPNWDIHDIASPKATDENLLDRIYEIFDKETTDENFESYSDDLFRLYCEILFELKLDGLFDETTEDFILLTQIGDSFMNNQEFKSLKLILSEKELREYLEL